MTAQKERPDYEIAREELAQLMKAHALAIVHDFIPFSKSRNAPGVYDPGPCESKADHEKRKAKGWRSLNWRVALVRYSSQFASEQKWDSAHQRAIYETEYASGEGHCPAYKSQEFGRPNSINGYAAVSWEIENGKAYTGKSWKPGGAVIRPDSVDVFAAMVRDAQDALDAGDFESWAETFGYDTDSRRAESIYQQCAAAALKLASGIGTETLRKAADLAGRL